jgi:membrane protein DedA with SNARE-associated domain
MHRPLRLLLLLALAAVAVPLVPFLACGARLDALVAGWLDPPPAPPVIAALEVGVLAADLLLPVPSSMVATLGGATLGLAAGTACAWLGMTAGACAGWWLGRATAGRALARLDATERAALARHERRLGPLLVVLSRPLPLVAEAVALFAGAAGMPLPAFVAAAAGGNLAIAFAWSLAGALGRAADSLQWVLVASLLVPVAIALLALCRSGAASGLTAPAGPRSR